MIPIAFRKDDFETRKVEFYIRIYFSIYQIHPAFNPDMEDRNYLLKQELNHFKTYLDTKGSDLAKTSELLKYFALPYVDDPLSHESYKALFSPEWVDNMEREVI